MNTQMLKEGLVTSIVKRDDDAAILRTEDGDLYLETNQFLDEDEEISFTNANLLSDAARAKPLDANIRPLFVLFLITQSLSLQMLLFALPLYYWPLNQTARIIILVLAANGWIAFYAASIALPAHALILGEFWILSCTAMVGSIAGLTQSTIPFILMGLLWIQQMSMFIYIHWADSSVSYVHGGIIMFGATTCIWTVNIVTYGSAHEWIGGIVCLLLAWLAVFYNVWQIKMGHKRYHNGTRDIVRSLVNYYADPVLMVMQKINAHKT